MLGSGPLLLHSVKLLFSQRSFLLHLALDPGIKVVEEVIIHLLRGRLVINRPRYFRLVVSLDGPGPSFLVDLFFKLFDDEVIIGDFLGLVGEFLMQGGDALLLDAERLGGALIEIFIRTLIDGSHLFSSLHKEIVTYI